MIQLFLSFMREDVDRSQCTYLCSSRAVGASRRSTEQQPLWPSACVQEYASPSYR